MARHICEESYEATCIYIWTALVSTVESLSVFYLRFISWFMYIWRCFMDKLWLFHANKHVCVLIHIRMKGEVDTVKLVKAFQ